MNETPKIIEIQGLEGDKPQSQIGNLQMRLIKPDEIVKVVTLPSGLIARFRRGKVKDLNAARRVIGAGELKSDPTLINYALIALLADFVDAGNPPQKLNYEDILELPLTDGIALLEASQELAEGNFTSSPGSWPGSSTSDSTTLN